MIATLEILFFVWLVPGLLTALIVWRLWVRKRKREAVADLRFDLLMLRFNLRHHMENLMRALSAGDASEVDRAKKEIERAYRVYDDMSADLAEELGVGE